MKDFTKPVPFKFALFLLLTMTLSCFNSFAQVEQTEEKIIKDPIDVKVNQVLNELTDTDDIDNDGVPNEADLCPNIKGSLKYYGCLQESETYIWYEDEYEAYPARTTLEVSPAKFDTVTEQYLVKPAHNEGAVFEQVTEKVLVKEAHTKLEIVESKFLKTEREIVIDELTNKTIKIENFEMANPPSVKEVAVPAEYKTLIRQKVIKNGTGAEIDSQYETYTQQVFSSSASVKEVAVPAIKKVVKIRSKHPVNYPADEEETEIYTITEEMPKFPGNDIELLKYFGTNIIYPEEAKAMNIQGVVVIGFVVAKDGSIQDLELIRDIGGGCGEEALRLAALMPKWSPGKQRGKPVNVAYKLPIRFKL